MTKIFCSYCGTRLRIMGEPILSDDENSYIVDVRHKCLDAPLASKKVQNTSNYELDVIDDTFGKYKGQTSLANKIISEMKGDE
jgi:hypothetical protein